MDGFSVFAIIYVLEFFKGFHGPSSYKRYVIDKSLPYGYMLCCSAGEFFSRFAIQILTHGDAIFVLIVSPTSVSNFCQESQIILFENVH